MKGRTLHTLPVRLAIWAVTALAPFAAAYSPALAQRPAQAGSRETVAHYSCPTHPSVKSSKPGACPKCKMGLRRTAEVSAASAQKSDPPSEGAPNAKTGMRIPDVELLDQDGRKVRFYSDLVRGKVVAINFIFTTCTTVCPPLGATFARVQRELGERAGRDVHLISISVDPATDTPERLKAWGAKFKAGPGWTFVTGEKPQVDELLRALDASAARREDHTPTVLVGNDTRGQWTRTYGLAAPSKLVRVIDDAAGGRLGEDTKESKE